MHPGFTFLVTKRQAGLGGAIGGAGAPPAPASTPRGRRDQRSCRPSPAAAAPSDPPGGNFSLGKKTNKKETNQSSHKAVYHCVLIVLSAVGKRTSWKRLASSVLMHVISECRENGRKKRSSHRLLSAAAGQGSGAGSVPEPPSAALPPFHRQEDSGSDAAAATPSPAQPGGGSQVGGRTRVRCGARCPPRHRRLPLPRPRVSCA